jgi:acyl carrier protein
MDAPVAAPADDVTATIRQLLAEHGKLGSRAEALGVNDDLYREGLTSHGSVGVLLALEDTFDVEFDDDVVTRRLFSSISTLEAAVRDALGKR